MSLSFLEIFSRFWFCLVFKCAHKMKNQPFSVSSSYLETATNSFTKPNSFSLFYHYFVIISKETMKKIEFMSLIELKGKD